MQLALVELNEHVHISHKFMLSKFNEISKKKIIIIIFFSLTYRQSNLKFKEIKLDFFKNKKFSLLKSMIAIIHTLNLFILILNQLNDNKNIA